jgi:hypothetical protein
MTFLLGEAMVARETLRPDVPSPRIARAFQRDGALAAQGLALFLIECGDTTRAEVALGATRDRLASSLASFSNPPAMDRANLDIVEALIREVRVDGTRGMTAPPGQRKFDRTSKAGLMLDALAYGQKSWALSLRYLEIARAADPGNARPRVAHDELARIARQAQAR